MLAVPDDGAGDVPSRPSRRPSSMTLSASIVYIPDEAEVWIECTVQGQIDQDTIRVRDPAGNMRCVPVASCLNGIMYPDTGFDDMVTMSSLHEASVLHNLRLRFQQRIIYTKIADILVSLNPFTPMPIYGDDVRKQYRNGTRAYRNNSLQPHIYAFADEVFHRMRTTNRSQAIIISGESGAGKTEANKFIVDYLSKESLSIAGGGIHSRVLSTSPILEAFGNAKTVRNHNSSRFGKLLECQFNNQGALIGARFESYLLEKSRVASQNSNERNFHAFYYILAGISGQEKKSWNLSDAKQFSFLNQTGCYDIAGEDLLAEFRTLQNAMLVSGFTNDEFKALVGIMCAILHLGNVEFADTDQDAACIEGKIPESAMAIVAGILCCSTDELTAALTKRMTAIRDEIVIMNNDAMQAASTRDTLAQQLYERCFTFIVHRLNEEMACNSRDVHSSVLLLDMFGFESFKNNSFEQLCINYANERLQLLFNDYMFKFELAEYAAEKIDLGNIKYGDNQACVDLFEQKPLGLIKILDEESRFPKATDATFLTKLEHNLDNQSPSGAYFIKQRFGGNIFSIKHYSGVVPYTITDFLLKNRQQFSTSLGALVTQSQSLFVAHLFDDIIAATRQTPSNARANVRGSVQNSGTSKKTLITQFHESLVDLTLRLSSCDPHFIRCVKSNARNAPVKFDARMIACQLRDTGLVEAIRIRSEGYPQRHTFDSLLDRFGTLCPRARNRSLSQKQQLIHLFEFLGIECPSLVVQMGVSKVFFKDHVYERLETLVGCLLAEMATTIQRHVRGLQSRKRYRQIKRLSKRLQHLIRTYLQRRLRAAVTLQSIWRGRCQRIRYSKPVRTTPQNKQNDLSEEPVASVNNQRAGKPSEEEITLEKGSVEETCSASLSTSDNDPLPELDGLPIEARHLVNAAFHEALEFPALVNAVLFKAGQDEYAQSIARSRHLRHVVLMLGSDFASMQLLRIIALSTGSVHRFVAAGGMIKAKEAMFTSCSKPTVYDDGEAEAALKILSHIVSTPKGAELMVDDDEVIKGITICLYCRPNDVNLCKLCASVLSRLVWNHPPAVSVMIRLGGIEAVIQAWAFHEGKGQDMTLKAMYADIVALITHPLVMGNSSILDIVSELTMSPVELALRGLSSLNGTCADHAATLATALIRNYPSLSSHYKKNNVVTDVFKRLSEAHPPDPAHHLLGLLLQLCTSDLVILVAEACTSITSCLHRYNAIGGKTCSLALQLLSRLTYKMSRNTTLAIVECMELNYHDADLHRSCHQMLTKYAINDSILELLDILRNRSALPKDTIYALATISALCSVEERVKPLVDMGAVNVLLHGLQSARPCNALPHEMCPNALAVRALALLLQQSWAAQVQFRQCSGLRYVRELNTCCSRIVSANLDVVIALMTASTRMEDAVTHLSLCHSMMQPFLQTFPWLCVRFLSVVPVAMLTQIATLPATVLSMLSYYSGTDEHVTGAISTILPALLKISSSTYSRNVTEIIVMNALATNYIDDWRLMSTWLTIIAHCVASARLSGPVNELLTPDMFQFLLSICELNNANNGGNVSAAMSFDINNSIATQLLTEMLDVNVVPEVAVTVLRRQSLDREQRPLSPSSFSVLLPSGPVGAVSAIAFLAIDEPASIQLCNLQVISAIDAALHATINAPESVDREQLCDTLALALQRLSRHVRIRPALQNSGLLRTLDIMLVQTCPHYPLFVDRATRCIKNIPSTSQSPTTIRPVPSPRPNDGSTSALSRFKNIFATVINI